MTNAAANHAVLLKTACSPGLSRSSIGCREGGGVTDERAKRKEKSEK